MERLVDELNSIEIAVKGNQVNKAFDHIQQLMKINLKNCLPNMSIRDQERMPETSLPIPFSSNDSIANISSDISDTSSTNTTFSDVSSEDSSIGYHGENRSVDGESLSNTSGVRRSLRNLPSRASKPDALKSNLRTSMKSKKLKNSDIKKLYSNQNLKKFRPTKLETIFEDPQPVAGRSKNSNDNNTQVRLIGDKKMKRAIRCCDGFNVNKTLIKQRRAMIKKKIGRRHAWKKLPLNVFIEHMKNVMSPIENETNPRDNEFAAQNSEIASSASPKLEEVEMKD